MSNLTNSSDALNRQSANEDNRKEEGEHVDVIEDEISDLDKVTKLLDSMGELAKIRYGLTWTMLKGDVDNFSEIGDLTELIAKLLREVREFTSVIKDHNMRFHAFRRSERGIHFHLECVSSGFDVDLQLLCLIDKTLDSMRMLLKPEYLCDGSYLARGIQCMCVGECKHIDAPFCPFCLAGEGTKGVCNGCGVEIDPETTHCCQCHGNPRMCPICNEFHDGPHCVNKINLGIPQQIVGDRNKLAKMGLQTYILKTNYMAIKLADQRPYLADGIGFYMRRILAMMPNSAFGAKDQSHVGDFFQLMGDYLMTSMGSLSGLVFQKMKTAISSAVTVLLTEVISAMSPAVAGCVMFLKTLVRKHIFESCPLQIVVELMWDPTLITSLGALKKVMGDFIVGLGKNTPEGLSIDLRNPVVDQAGATGILATALFYMTASVAGVDPDKVGSFVRIVPLFDKLMPDDLPSFLKRVPGLNRLFGKDMDVHMAEKWPRTAEFLKINRKSVVQNWGELWQLNLLQESFYAYKQESKRFHDPDRIYWSKFRFELQLDKDKLKRLPCQRLEPFALYIHGLPGGGKTTGSTQIMYLVYMWFVQQMLLSSKSTFKQSIFDVPSGGKFWGGFFGQKIIRQNDFMCKKCVAGDPCSDAFTFMNLADSKPMEAPGASLDAKGNFVYALFLMLTGNLSWESCKANSELNNKDAMDRRITLSVCARPKFAAPDGSMSKDPADWVGIELWDRCIYTDDRTKEEYSLLQLVEKIIGMMHARMTAPDTLSTVEDAWSHLAHLPSLPKEDSERIRQAATNVKCKHMMKTPKVVIPDEKVNEFLMKFEPMPISAPSSSLSSSSSGSESESSESFLLPESDKGKEKEVIVDHGLPDFGYYFRSKNIDFEALAEGYVAHYKSGGTEIWDDGDGLSDRPAVDLSNMGWAEYLIRGYNTAYRFDGEYSDASINLLWVLQAITDLNEAQIESRMMKSHYKELILTGKIDRLSEFEQLDLASYRERQYDDRQMADHHYALDLMREIEDNLDISDKFEQMMEGGPPLAEYDPVRCRATKGVDLNEASFDNFDAARIADTIYENIVCTLIKIKMTAKDYAVKGAQITVEAANRLASAARVAMNFPNSLRMVSFKGVTDCIERNLTTIDKDYVSLIIGGLVLLAIANRYVSVPKAIVKPSGRNESQPVRTEFKLGSIVASDGLMEKIDRSIKAFSTNGVTTSGSVFAITSTEFIVPTHMLDSVDGEYWLRSKTDGDWLRYEMAEVGTKGGSVFVSDTELDLSVVRMTVGHVPQFSGNNVSKLVSKWLPGPGLCARVNLEALQDTMIGYREPLQVPHGGRRTKFCHPIEANSYMGLCGAVYVDSNAATDARIFGMHVSGHTQIDEGYCSPLSQEWYNKMLSQLDAWVCCKDPEEMKGRKLREYFVEGSTSLRNNLPKVFKKHPLESIQKACVKNGFAVSYAPAVLNGVGNDGLTPYQRGVNKLIGAVVAKNQLKTPVLTDEDRNVLLDIMDSGCQKIDHIEDWDTVCASMNGHNSVDKNKSAGLGAGLKKDYFGADGKLKVDFVKHLDEVVECMAKGDFKCDRTGSTLKSELRPIEKVSAGSTRLFYNGDFDVLLVCKRFLAPWQRWLQIYARDHGMHFECNPADSANMRSSKFGKIAFGFDVVKQDASHREWLYEEIFHWGIKTGLVSNDPDSPGAVYFARFGIKLERNNIVRYGCFVQCMNTIYVLESALFRGEGALPSGSFLTFILNCFGQLFIIKLFKKKHLVDPDFLGDDTILTPVILNTMKKGNRAFEDACLKFAQNIESHWKFYGYDLTSQIKEREVHAELHQNVTLCGRSLICDDGAFKCPLESTRIMKSVCWYNKADPSEYAQTVLNFCSEFVNQERRVAKKMVTCLIWPNGCQMIEYTGSSDEIIHNLVCGNVDVVQQGIRTWMTHGLKTGRKNRRFPVNSELVFFHTVEDASKLGVNPYREQALVVNQMNDGDETLVVGEVPADTTLKHMRHNPITETIIPRGVDYRVLHREMILKNGAVANTNVPGDVLMNLMMPTAIFDISQRMLAELENTAYFMYDAIVLRFTFNVSGFHSGGVIITASPMARAVAGSISSACSGPNIIVNFQKNNSEAADMKRRIEVEVTIPFNRDFFATPSLGYLIPDTAMNFCRVTMMVLEMGNSSTQGPIPFVVKARFINPKVIESSSSWLTTPSPFRNHGKEEADLVGGPTSSTSVAGPTGNQNSTINNYPFSNVGNGNSANVEDVKVSVGACKPVVPSQMTFTRNGYGFGAASCTGGDGSIVMGAGLESRGVMHPMANQVDQMSFEYMSRQPYLVDRFVWLKTTVAETLLWTGLVGPWPTPGNGVAGLFPLLASMFMHWKADIVVHFEAFPNALTTGTYMVVVDYNIITDNPLSYGDTDNMYRVFVDLEEGCSVTVRVPYLFTTPWHVANDEVLPRISVFSVTSLGVNSGGSDNVPFRIFYHAENVMFMWPYYNQEAPPAILSKVRKFLEPIKKEKGKGKEVVKGKDQALDGETKMVVPYASYVVLGPEDNRYMKISAADYMLRFGDGEVITDLRTLMKRFTTIKVFSPAADSEKQFIHDPGVLTSFPEWYVNLSRAFVFQYGGIRYKLYPRQDSVAIMAATWSRTGFNILEPEAFMATGSVAVSEVQINPCARFPYRIISQDDQGLPQFLASRSMTSDSKLLFAVSESFEWFGGNYLSSQTFMPTGASWFVQQPDSYPL